MTEEQVVLVNQEDSPIGVMEKIEAHEKGRLHRAFSVFLFDSRGRMLIQQRAANKYHSAGMWTNTCCSHPRPGEDLLSAAQRRLMEEMGMHCDLQHLFWFIYKAQFDNGLTEHELDHVFIGHSDALPVPNHDEVLSYKYITVQELLKWIDDEPLVFTAWFKICLPRLVEHLERV